MNGKKFICENIRNMENYSYICVGLWQQEAFAKSFGEAMAAAFFTNVHV